MEQREQASERAAELTSGARGTEREGSRARRKLAPISRPHQEARGRESACEMALTHGVHLSGRGARGEDMGRAGPTGLNLFSFFP
jgi:hypothetical protein